MHTESEKTRVAGRGVLLSRGGWPDETANDDSIAGASFRSRTFAPPPDICPRLGSRFGLAL